MYTEFKLLRIASGLSTRETADLLDISTATVKNYETGKNEPKKPVLELLKARSEQYSRTRPEPTEGKFSFIDLFAGIGGMRTGFEKAGGKCNFTCEWNPYAVETYVRNFGYSHPIAEDITKLKPSDIPEHDILVAGFPCQPFSLAGVSKKNALGRPHGFDCETQGTLFFDVERIIAHHQPPAFLLENVKNLKSHDKGNTFRVIMDTLENKLGYTVFHKVIDARAWVPQHRERIFIVGFREPVPFSFDDVKIPPLEAHPKLEHILHPGNGDEAPEEPFTVGNMGRVNSKYTLTPKLWKYLFDYAAKHRAKGNGFGYGLNGPEDVSRTLSARYYKDGSESLIRQGKKKPPRRLTPRECARLMGFDRENLPPFEIPVSDTQAYKQFGNSVVSQAVEEIAKAMSSHVISIRDRKRKKAVVNG
jgi:DNA (cytosine-5)-methyltransferase 1